MTYVFGGDHLPNRFKNTECIHDDCRKNKYKSTSFDKTSRVFILCRHINHLHANNIKKMAKASGAKFIPLNL